MRSSPPSVLLLGFGAIGRQLVPQFAPAEARFRAIVRDLDKHERLGSRGAELSDVSSWPELLRSSDIVVECAGVQAARQKGPEVIAAGRDLVLTSVGALADPEARAGLLGGPGLLHVTAGAIGGFDVLGAAAEAGGLDEVEIRTLKLAPSLVQPWMSAGEAERLRRATQPVVVFRGGPAEAIERFPGNVNVAVALAWATRGLAGRTGRDEAVLLAESLERVGVTLIADPAAERSVHEITARGEAGEFHLRFESAPSPVNPKTSGLTALAVAYTLRRALT